MHCIMKQQFLKDATYNEKVFKPKKYNEKPLNSRNLIDLLIDYTLQQLEKATYKVLEVNSIKNTCIITLVFPGNNGATIYL